MVKNKAYIGILLMLACALLWSLNGLSIRLIAWNAFVLAGWRGFFAAAALYAAMRLLKYRVVFDGRTALIGACVCATGLLYILANRLTTAANAIVLQYTSPVWRMAPGIILFGKRFRGVDFAAVALVLGGVALFFFDELTPGGALGNIIAIIGGCTLAGAYVLMGEAERPRRLSGVLAGLLMMALAGIPFTFLYPPKIAAADFALVAAMGVFMLGLPYALYGIASDHCPPLGCVIIGSAEIVLNPVWVWLALGEAPDRFALIGGAIILVTITLWCALGGAKPKEGLPRS